jgi:uncharacterized membrane protein
MNPMIRFILIASLCLAGCNASPGTRVTTPSGEACGELTYENFAEDFMDTYCLRCHSSSLTGIIARTGAPEDTNFNTLTDVRDEQNRIRLRAGVAGTMPPSAPFPTEDERAQLLNWIDCGTISDTD